MQVFTQKDERARIKGLKHEKRCSCLFLFSLLESLVANEHRARGMGERQLENATSYEPT